jgi:hypothetical protein
MKKVILRILLGLVILVIIAVVVVFFSLNSIVKKGVESVGPRITKVDVRLDSAKVSPLSGNGELSGLFVGNPEGYKTPSAIKAGDIKVGVEPSSVLSDTLVVNEVNIQSPEITFEGSLSGNNLSKILDNIQAATGGGKTETTPTKQSEKKFFVKDLVVNAGKINVNISTPLGGKSATVPLPEIHLQNIGSRDHGVTAGELAKQILQPLLVKATEAVTENVGGLGKGLQDFSKGAGSNQLDKAAQGLKNIFKK